MSYVLKLMNVIIHGDKKVLSMGAHEHKDQQEIVSHQGGDGGAHRCGRGLRSRRLATGRWANRGPSRSRCRPHHCRHAHYLSN